VLQLPVEGNAVVQRGLDGRRRRHHAVDVDARAARARHLARHGQLALSAGVAGLPASPAAICALIRPPGLTGRRAQAPVRAPVRFRVAVLFMAAVFLLVVAPARPPAGLEQRLHQGSRRAGTHEALVSLVSQQQADGLREQRLAGAGLAGDHVEARGELEPRLCDEDEVIDGELGEHRQSAYRERLKSFSSTLR
jgi:hypothetical protein